MKKLTKLSLAIALAVSVAACGDKDKAPAAQNASETQTQTQAAAAPAKVSLADQLPKFDQKLLEPITISDKKSATAIDDFNKFVAFNQKYERNSVVLQNSLKAKVVSEGKKMQEQGKASPEFTAAYNELVNFANKYTEEAKKLSFKDAEVKALAERSIAITEFGVRASGEMVRLSLEGVKESQAVQQELFDKTKALSVEMKQAQQVLADAINTFMKKYQ